MILVADSGASKTDFALIGQGVLIKTFKTIGLHPYQLSETRIANEIQDVLVPYLKGFKIDTIKFFGSGCGSDEGKMIIRKQFRSFFPESKIEVEGDMMAACFALFGKDGQGVAAILGTGSNACVYQNGTITNTMVSLGYLLGDEGSGNHIGRLFLQRAYYGELDRQLLLNFESHFQMDRVAVLHKLYKDEGVGRFLASVCEFVIQNKTNDAIQTLIADSFHLFVNRHLLKLLPKHAPSVCFVGSVAYYLQEELENVLHGYGINLHQVLQHPMEAIINQYIKDWQH